MPPVSVRNETPGTEPLLELLGLDCRFTGPGHGFGNVDLRIGPGDRIGITGPNGCGKSTLLAACAGARRPDQGSVRLNGRILYSRKSKDLGHGSAMLAPQFPEYLFTRSTVAQEIHLDPVLAKRDPAGFLAELGLATNLAARNPHDLSSGQRRRLALGMVLVSNRPVLLLDEPTAALDSNGRSVILKLLDRASAGTALVIASHDREFLAAAGCSILTLPPKGLVPLGA